jgi:hypothetical protein
MIDSNFFVFVISFVAGYAVGSIDLIKRSILGSNATVNVRIPHEEKDEQSSSFLSGTQKEQKLQKKKISIDESTFVTDISTENIEMKGAALGVVSQTSDNISTAANKLAQLKKSKG